MGAAGAGAGAAGAGAAGGGAAAGGLGAGALGAGAAGAGAGGLGAAGAGAGAGAAGAGAAGAGGLAGLSPQTLGFIQAGSQLAGSLGGLAGGGPGFAKGFSDGSQIFFAGVDIAQQQKQIDNERDRLKKLKKLAEGKGNIDDATSALAPQQTALGPLGAANFGPPALPQGSGLDGGIPFFLEDLIRRQSLQGR